LARKARRAPKEIAQELALAAEAIPGVWKVAVAGAGYLNFYLDRPKLGDRALKSIEDRRYGLAPARTLRGKIIVEHTNINPNKAAISATCAMRQIGDSFVRCLRFLGRPCRGAELPDNTESRLPTSSWAGENVERPRLKFAAVEGKFDYYCWDVYARVPRFLPAIRKEPQKVAPDAAGD